MVVGQLVLKGGQHILDQAVFVLGNAHGPLVLPKEGDALAHEVLRRGDPAGDYGLIYLRLFPQIIHQPFFLPVHNGPAILDGDLLLSNEPGQESGDVNLLPTEGDGLVAALDISHRNGGTIGLQLQPLADLVEGILVVGAAASDAGGFLGCAVENG